MTQQEAMELTEEECNRRIAEWEGWYSIHEVPFTDELHIKWTELFGVNPKSREEENIPRYTTSLDACHEAEKKVMQGCGSWFTHVENLRKITNETHPYFATASQRSRALVMTIQKEEK